jgi:hypothetical protein
VEIENATQALEHYQVFLALTPYSYRSEQARAEIERMSGYAITSPGPGATIAGSVPVMGTTLLPDFQFFKLEYGAGPHPQEWTTIGDIVTTQVENGLLGTWDASGLPAGDYVLRLVVVDSTYNYPPAYTVPVAIK